MRAKFLKSKTLGKLKTFMSFIFIPLCWRKIRKTEREKFSSPWVSIAFKRLKFAGDFKATLNLKPLNNSGKSIAKQA